MKVKYHHLELVKILKKKFIKLLFQEILNYLKHQVQESVFLIMMDLLLGLKLIKNLQRKC